MGVLVSQSANMLSTSVVDRRQHRWAGNLAPNSTTSPVSSSAFLSSSPSSASLVPMYSFIALLISSLISPSESISCELARNKCAFRNGCGMSLQSYMVECSSLIAGQTDRCHQRCENALVALVSTEDGANMVHCDCEGSKYCEKSKQRIQVCRPAVDLAVQRDTIVSCQTAHYICMADDLCRTALEYYHMYCRGLFHGSKCTNRCKNSLSILERQEKAAKLRTCFCDGTEDFPCKRVKYNTERYCYSRIKPNIDKDLDNGPDNSIEVIGSSAVHHGKRHKHKHRIDATSAAVGRTLQSTPLLMMATAVLAIAANRFRWTIALLPLS